MEKTEVIKKYELILILDARLSNDEKQAIVSQSEELVKKSGGKLIKTNVWMEKHKLTFEIKKCNEGTYYIIEFESSGDAIDSIKAPLRLNEKILRYAILKSELEAAAPAVS